MLDLLIVSLYVVIALIVGIYYSRNVKSMRDFSSSNKSFSMPIIMATISATYIGGEFIFGIAEKSSEVGAVFFLALLGTCFGKFFLANSVVPRLSKYTHTISVGEIMQENYGTIGRVVTGLASGLLCIGYIGAQIGACASLFNYFFAVPQLLGIMVACAIVVIFSAFGGFRAVTFTDVLQFGVLIVAVPIIASYSLNQIGGYGALLALLPKSHIIPSSEVFFDHLIWFMVFFVPFLDPALMQRMTMDRDVKKLASAWRLSALFDIPFYLVVCTIGAIALVSTPELKSTEAFLTVMSNLPKGLIGLAMAGVLAVVMSTADSYLNVASISLVHDVIKPLSKKNMSDSFELKLARLMTIFLGIAAILASLRFQSLLDMLISFMNYSWVPLVVAPLYATIFGYSLSPRSFIVAGVFAILSKFMWPLLFGIDSEVWALMMSPFMSALALWLSHYFFQKAWPKRKAFLGDISKKRLGISWPKIGGVPSLMALSKQRVDSFGASYVLFGLFAVLNYMVPYFMWSSSEGNINLHLWMRFFAALLSFGLIMHEYWPPAAQRFLPLYWYASLGYCLPFFSTFMLLDNGGASFWLYNIVLALFLLAALVDWISFVVLLFIGSMSACLVFYYLRNDFFTFFGAENTYLLMYMYVFAVMIGIIFSRRNEKILREKMETLKSMSASIAHEMRTPLATIAIGAHSLQKYIPIYNKVYEDAKGAGLSIPHIGHTEQRLIKEIPCTMETVSNNAQNIINMLLMRTKDISDNTILNFSNCSMQHCIKNALLQFPLSPQERECIKLDSDNDFFFIGKEEMTIHIFFNLLKNSLCQINPSEGGSITIWITTTESNNKVHFKDNGPGVPKNILLHLFDYFVSGTEFGAGMGLAYCKMAMNAFGGRIECISQEGLGAEFVLCFPKH